MGVDRLMDDNSNTNLGIKRKLNLLHYSNVLLNTRLIHIFEEVVSSLFLREPKFVLI